MTIDFGSGDGFDPSELAEQPLPGAQVQTQEAVDAALMELAMSVGTTVGHMQLPREQKAELESTFEAYGLKDPFRLGIQAAEIGEADDDVCRVLVESPEDENDEPDFESGEDPEGFEPFEGGQELGDPGVE